jgi:hypothetical protein
VPSKEEEEEDEVEKKKKKYESKLGLLSRPCLCMPHQGILRLKKKRG